ncbi:MAG: hypothetical protein E6997_11630 [Citrobacter sp.]|uniref:hypothetical protein n=1 Tax=Citrobacter braakii TaxID=57706 RepID=UPI001903C11A|nr:hypothetical protein [Citrobacter braakii]MBJ8953691.1 hypothetical protein [Citrobacter braakii]MDU1183639.1 hypothetical protein [Citrobacter sp.]
MNHFDLSFLKYLQDNSPLPVEEAVERFGKTLSTLKRTMKELNELLPENVQLHQDNQFITTRIGYSEYRQFLARVQFNRYITTAEERVKDLFVALCLHDVVNKNDYYKKFYVSAGTVKNDNPVMMSLVQERDLIVQSIPRKGSRLAGDEFQLRLAACMTILKTVEIGEDHRLIAHQANEPTGRSIAEQFLHECAAQINQAADYYEEKISPVIALGYNGRKYLLVYLSLALHRIRRGHRITESSAAEFLTTFPYGVLPDADENICLDLLIASLTFTHRPFTLYDARLVSYVKRTCHALAGCLENTIHNQHAWFAEIYNFIYAAIIQNKFHLWFDDKKLHDVQRRYPELWEHVQYAVKEIEHHWQTTFSAIHLATLVLIIKKYALKNRVVGDKKKRVIIVTNSSESKVGYFKEMLFSRFHIEIPACININEIARLQQLEFDLLITFTNKISSHLRYAGLDYVKVNFWLTQDDLLLLRENGLPSARKKIPAENFIQQVQGMSQEALKIFLDTHYSDIFI